MGFRSILLVIFLLLNGFAYVALWWAVAYWVPPERRRRRVMLGVSLVFLLLNLPLVAFFIRRLDLTLLQMPRSVLEVVFYPATAWLATITAFFLIAAPLLLAGMVGKGIWQWERV